MNCDSFNSTGQYYYDINEKCHVSHNRADVALNINSTYENILEALNNAARFNIPSRKTNFFKFWWDQELDELKKNSNNSH